MLQSARTMLDWITDRVSDSRITTDARGTNVIRVNRAQTKPAVEVFLLLLGIGLVGGLAFSLSGISSDVLPGPNANVGLTQDGANMTITVDNVDNNVGNITVQVTSNGSSSNRLYAFNDSGGDDPTALSMSGDDPTAGDTLIIPVNRSEIVSVVAHADDSENTNRIARKEVGPTG